MVAKTGFKSPTTTTTNFESKKKIIQLSTKKLEDKAWTGGVFKFNSYSNCHQCHAHSLKKANDKMYKAQFEMIQVINSKFAVYKLGLYCQSGKDELVHGEYFTNYANLS